MPAIRGVLINLVNGLQIIFFLLQDQDEKVIAAIKCNLVIENEEVNELNHWPQSTGCTDCAFDSKTLKEDLQKIDLAKLKNGIPPSV